MRTGALEWYALQVRVASLFNSQIWQLNTYRGCLLLPWSSCVILAAVIDLCHQHNPAEDSLLYGVRQYITEIFRLPLHIVFVTPFVLITR
jgi:hypothetical protein